MQFSVSADPNILPTSRTALSKSTVRPPTNIREKRTAHRRNRNEAFANKYLFELRRAFDDADVECLGSLTPEQWGNSAIRLYMKNGKLSDQEFEQFFLRIDANVDGRVSWEELVEFILLDLTCVTRTQTVNSPFILNRSPTTEHTQRHKHRERIFQILQSLWTDEYITASRDSIKFWNPFPLQFKRNLPSPGPFAAICCFKQYQILGVATTTRTLKFYKIINLEQLPIFLSASPSAKTIRSMDMSLATKTMQQLQNDSVPLYNVPTQMIEDTLNLAKANEMKFIVADDCGCIELYSVTMPQRRTGTDYKIDRVINYKLQKKSITQLTCIDEMECYAAASQDGTVKFFLFNKNNKVEVTRVFDTGDQVTSFNFISKQQVLAICTISDNPFIWSTQPVRRTFQLSSNLNTTQLVTNYTSSLGDKYLLTISSKKELKLFYSTNFVIRSEFIDTDYLPPENRITAVMFDKSRKILVTCAAYPALWLEGEVDGPRGITHQLPIVGIHYQPDFDQLLSVDTQANFTIWDYSTGVRKTTRTASSDELSNAAIDNSGRRVITATFSGKVQVWNTSSGGWIASLEQAAPPEIDPSIKQNLGSSNSNLLNQLTVLEHFTLNGKGLLVTAGLSKVVTVYREIEPSEFELLNHFVGHKGEITCAVLDHRGWIITSSDKGEIIEWPIDMAAKARRFQLIDDTPIEFMSIIDHFLFVADSDGCINVFRLPGLEDIFYTKAHTETVPYSLSAICSSEKTLRTVTGDSLGYIRQWIISTNPFKCEAGPLIRAHNGEVTHLQMIGPSGQFFASAGEDMAVRIWATESMNYVGTFDNEMTWDLKDAETWGKVSPIEIEPIHFASRDSSRRLLSDPSVKSFTSVKSSNGLLSQRSLKPLDSSKMTTKSRQSIIDFLALKEHIEEEDANDKEQHLEFNYESAKQILDMITNSEPNQTFVTYHTSVLDKYPPISDKKEKQRYGQLSNFSEMNELLMKVKELQNQKFTSLEDSFSQKKSKKKVKPSLTFA